MKKNILKSPESKPLFKFKNSDSKPKFFGNLDISGLTNTDPTTTTTTAVTHMGY